MKDVCIAAAATIFASLDKPLDESGHLDLPLLANQIITLAMLLEARSNMVDKGLRAEALTPDS
jgi:hypothetical protein